MRFSHRYIGLVLLPPIVILLPLATAFLVKVTHVTRWLPMASTAAAIYIAGAILFYLAVEPYARRSMEQRTSEAISACLARTIFGAAVLWLGGGLLLALTGWAAIR